MSSTILERIRFNHEIAEVYEKSIGDVLDERVNGVSYFCEFIQLV